MEMEKPISLIRCYWS